MTLVDCGHPALWYSYSPKTVKRNFHNSRGGIFWNGTSKINLSNNTKERITEAIPILWTFDWLLNYLAFKYFDFDRTWWRLLQKRMVRTKLDFYVFIIMVICLILFLMIETSSKLKGQISRNFFLQSFG